MTRYCVIGAGAAGISALEQLRSAGYEVDCYERTDRVGGHWHTDYDALHLITSRDTTSFEHFPMPADYPHFPRRDQVRTTFFSLATFSVPTFFSRWLSVNGPFLTERPMLESSYRFLLLRLTAVMISGQTSRMAAAESWPGTSASGLKPGASGASGMRPAGSG